MTDPEKDKKPFDERAALENLELFQSEIARYRRQRQAAHQEFEQFVTSLPSPESVFPSERPPVRPEKGTVTDRATTRSHSPGTAAAGPPSVPTTPAPAPQPSAVRPAPPAVPSSAKVRSGAAAAPSPARPAPATVPVPRTHGASAPNFEASAPKRSKVPLLLVVLLLAVAGGFWIWNARRAAPQAEPTIPAPVAQEPAATPAPAPPAATAPPAPPAATTESVVTTVRRAWVRVIADGERVVERELAADARVAFNAEKTIVVRTGDAGAVRLSIRGEDQGVLGRDGQVVTRTFEVPAKPR